MNRLLLTGLISASAISLVSCDKETENSYTNTTPVSAYNLYVSAAGDAVPSTGSALYKFTLKFPESTIQVSADNMALPGGSTSSFFTVGMNLASATIKVDETSREVIAFGADEATESGSAVSELSGYLTQAAYLPPDITVPGYKLFVPSNTLHYVVMQYALNDRWNVRTFWPDATFKGSTITSYPGMTEAYSNSNISYRIVMHLNEDKAVTDKADIIFYNAKFAPKAPEITVVLKNLYLEFNDRGYTVKGDDVIPYMVEAEDLQETPRFKFNKFDMRVTGDLTSAVIEYQVADVYKGSFSGVSVVRPTALD